MKIAIVTLGSRGDVQPFIALGVGLKRAGHEVTLCTSDRFQTVIRSHGLDYAYMNDDLVRIVETDEGRAAIESGGNPLKLLKKVKPIIRRTLDEAWAAARDCQAIIYHPKAQSGLSIAEKLAVPSFASIPIPLSATRAFPNPLLPDWKLGGWFNKQSYKLLRLVGLPYIDVINQWREEALSLPKRSLLASEFFLGNGEPVPFLYPFSSLVLPRPDDWPQSAIITGYWFLDRLDSWQPPKDLVEFIAAGAPPIYIGFGSMAGRNPLQQTKLVIEALQKSGRRGILAAGWGGLEAIDLPDNIFQIKSIPHDWLFPQMAAVVHHGGSGTTAAGLRAGKPTVICPFFGDQPFWGRRIFELGAGTKPIPQKKLTADNLADAMRAVTSDEKMRQRAAELGAEIRAEDGVGRAVEFIQKRLLDSRK